MTGWSQLNELVDLILVEHWSHWSREEAEHGDQHTGSIIIVTTTSMLVINSRYCISSYMHSSSVKVLMETIHNL